MAKDLVPFRGRKRRDNDFSRWLPNYFSGNLYQEILSKGKKMGNFIAKLRIKAKSGQLKINRRTGHCNFWFYEHFDLSNDVECFEMVEL
ncbi:MAG TPA: hypothetical protein ENG03_07015 [Thioploca sp.]|nr:MAG: hypothetical protein DRR19_03390 [Gammaproteobacteria bacterium]HDN26834.1 hypothetical protein [Thioploca sp.]